MKKTIFFLIFLFLIMVGGYLYYSYTLIYSKFNLTSNPNNYLNYTIGNPRAKKTIRYAALGDSLTAGVGAKDIRYTFPYLMAEKIAGQTTKVKLLNLGQPGAKSYEVLTQQLLPLNSFDPNLITIFIGTNDIHNFVSLETFKENYTRILNDLAKYKKAKILLINIPYLGADQLIRIPYNWYFDWQIQKYNQIIDDLAKENKLTLIDLYHKTKMQFANEQSKAYSEDLFHPSTYGYVLWADIVYASFH